MGRGGSHQEISHASGNLTSAKALVGQVYLFMNPLGFVSPERTEGKRTGADSSRLVESLRHEIALGGDKGYRANWVDDYLLALGISPVIPSKENEDRDARPVDFDRDAYRDRNIVERLIGWLKESRRIFSRFEKTAKNFGGMLKMAFIQQYLRYDVELNF